jgi:hypothetical protein
MTEPLSKEYLAAVRQRCKAATEGIWISSVEGRDHPLGGDTFILREENDKREEDLYLTGGTIADHDFIANAKQDIPLLLREIERLQLEVQRLQELLNK